MTLHVCIFTTAHPWDDVRVKSKFVDSFLAAGDKVTWIGPDVSFFEAASNQDPRVTYRLLPSKGGWPGRLRRFRALRAELRRVPNVDWIYTPDPDAAALALTAGTKAKVIFDIHEEYHKGHFLQSLDTTFIAAAEAAVRTAISFIAKRADLVTSVNQAILDTYHTPPERSLVIFNTPPDWFTRPKGKMTPSPAQELTFFHGKALAHNGTRVILSALKILQTRGRDVRVIMFPSAGLGSSPYDEDFTTVVSSLGVERSLDLRAAVSHRGMPEIMASAQVGLIAYDRALGTGSLPNRFFEYMALGMPIIAPSYSPLMREILEGEEVGWTADFEDPDSVADALERALNMRGSLARMGEVAHREFQEEYSWGSLFAMFYSRLNKMES